MDGTVIAAVSIADRLRVHAVDRGVVQPSRSQQARCIASGGIAQTRHAFEPATAPSASLSIADEALPCARCTSARARPAVVAQAADADAECDPDWPPRIAAGRSSAA